MKYFILIPFLIIFGCGEKTAQEEKPLIVFLHGYGDSKEHFDSLKKEFEPEFDVLALNGFFNVSCNTYSWGKVLYNENSNTWFNQKDGRYSTFKLRSLFMEESRKIILVGVSQGATIAYSLALNYPKTFKHLVAINGYAEEGLMVNLYHPKYDNSNFLRINGENDFIINQQMVDNTTRILDSLDIKNQLITHQQNHSYGAEETKALKEWIYNLKTD